VITGKSGGGLGELMLEIPISGSSGVFKLVTGSAVLGREEAGGGSRKRGRREGKGSAGSLRLASVGVDGWWGWGRGQVVYESIGSRMRDLGIRSLDGGVRRMCWAWASVGNSDVGPVQSGLGQQVSSE
jgi:hypothetical protein